jgi:hypothetical protein
MGSTDRVLALDWLRGLGVLIMLQGHLFNSFAQPALNSQPVYIFSQFIGGMPAPIFLFLVGATLAFAWTAPIARASVQSPESAPPWRAPPSSRSSLSCSASSYGSSPGAIPGRRSSAWIS